MATKRKIPLNKINNVSAGNTATITMPKNVRHHGFALEYDTTTAGGATEANMVAEIKEVRVLINNKVQRKASAKEIFAINRSKGKEPTVGDGVKPGYIPVFFSEPQRETQVERESTAWGMLGVGSFTIEVDIVDNGQTPTLKGFAIVDDVQEAPKGIIKWQRKTITVSGTGELPYSVEYPKGDNIQGLYLFEQAAGDIANTLLEWDNAKMHQLEEYQDVAFMEQFADGFVNVSGVVHLPLDGNHPPDALRTFKIIDGKRYEIQEIQATLDMAVANNVTLISELVGLPA